ncbi:MAG: hypothetical protein J4G09_11040 [Proteobacteria bacterium]|nr:hypothetical protein [Pseudomonadota bacterium]
MAKPPPSKVVSLLDSELSEMSRNERLKADSQGLFWVAGKRPHSFREEVESLARGEAANLGNEA